MSSTPQVSHVRELRDALTNLFITNSTGREFIPCDTFDSLMKPEVISLVFHEIVTTNSPQYHMLDYQKWYKTVEQKLPKILAILVWLGKEKLLCHFFLHGKDDSNLPLNKEDLGMIEPSLPNTRFREKQFCFIAIRFTKGQERHWHSDYILPFLEDKPLRGGEGGFGVVHEVKIHEAYNDMWVFLPGEEHVFARKELILDDLNDMSFEMEKSAFKTLQAKYGHPNIVPLLACYKHGEKYNLIFPKADSDLHKYFHESPKPQGDVEIFNLMTQISGLASALDEIHNCDISIGFGENRMDLSHMGYHRDLKPKNILKKGNEFMISDFGLARFKRRTSRSEMEWELGESTYFAPECKRGAKVGRRADVWSLGCIFSEVVTFALLGKEGIQTFSEKRERPAEVGSDFTLDIFHDGKRLNPEVTKWFEHLREVSGSEFISSILDLVEEMLNSAPDDRPEAKDVPVRFERILHREEMRIGHTFKEPTSAKSDRSSVRSLISGSLEFRSSFTSPDALPRDLQDIVNPSRILGGPRARNSIINNPDFKPTHLQAMRELALRLSISRHRFFSEQDLKKPRAQARAPSTLMQRHASSEPKVVVPTPKPLLYKVPGYLKGPGKRNSGKNPFDYLGEFDTVFLIDDSESMIPAWNSVALALFRFLEFATERDPDGVDLYFMSSEVSLQDEKSAAAVFNAFQDVQPHGSTFMNLKLDKLLTDYVQKFRADREKTKKLNLIVITDGDISSINSPETAIANCAQQLDSALAQSCQVGVQFVLIGSEEEARTTFQDLDDNLWKRNGTRDMVDVTVYDPDMGGRDDVTLLKIMCGAVNRVLDVGGL